MATLLITPPGNAVHRDFFSVGGVDIPEDAEMEFSTAVGIVKVRPDFMFPHLALLEALPGSVPVGSVDLRIISATVPPSNVVPITVTAGPAPALRILQTGEAKTRPYTIAFVANPAIESASGVKFGPDPILTNRPGFQNLVLHGLRNLFQVTEDLLRQHDFHARVRIISIFDPTRPANTANALAQEVPASNMMETRRPVLAAFLAGFSEVADVVFVVHGSTTHTRASAWFTTDDPGLPGTSYTFDGLARTHRHFPRIPGSAAIPVSLDQRGLTILHEFGHAASDFTNGQVTDLYEDGGAGTDFLVNKKFRAAATDPVPASFANYNGTTFASDPTRNGLGYEPAWHSYHARLLDGTRPNLMDNYWLALGDEQLCRLDELTYFWFMDRLNAKFSR